MTTLYTTLNEIRQYLSDGLYVKAYDEVIELMREVREIESDVNSNKNLCVVFDTRERLDKIGPTFVPSGDYERLVLGGRLLGYKKSDGTRINFLVNPKRDQVRGFCGKIAIVGDQDNFDPDLIMEIAANNEVYK